MVYTSGALGVTPDGKMVEGPIEGRVKQILDNLEAVLEAHGSSLKHIVKSLIFVSAVWRQAVPSELVFTSPRSARTMATRLRCASRVRARAR